MRTLPALLAVALLVPAAPAAAETWSAPDRPRDVRSFEAPADPSDCDVDEVRRPQARAEDITRLTVDHGTESLTVSIRTRELDTRRAFSIVYVRTPRRDLEVTVFRGPDGLEAWLMPEPDFPEPEPGDCLLIGTSIGLPCDGLEAQASAADRALTVTVPRTCLKSPDWVKVGADLSGPQGYDRWAPRGVQPAPGSYVVYGPRVRSGA